MDAVEKGYYLNISKRQLNYYEPANCFLKKWILLQTKNWIKRVLCGWEISKALFEERRNSLMVENSVSRGRKIRLAYNAASALVYQVIAIVAELILPRLFLSSYGSEVNGLVNSVTQFLGFISFFELGIGAVVISALYKPLAEHNEDGISAIMSSARKFYANIGKALIVYIVVLIAIYPFINNSGFDGLYSGGLILAISISSFVQYFFGATDRLLLTADQKGYIQYTIQSITLIITTIVSVILIKLGSGIHVVKLAASIIYIIRPVFIRAYINRNYSINRHFIYKEEPLKQKWNGIAQHIAAYVLDGTDTIVLTLFSTLKNVSIYSIYHLVIFGVNQLFFALTSGVQALLGELWAKKEKSTLDRTFSWFEWIVHSSVVLIYGCTSVLITPFVLVYTSGITDANYNTPLFGLMLTLAFGVYGARLPYSIMILAANHYKQTQKIYLGAAAINVIASILMVKSLGLVGVAIGTLIAITFQTIWMAWYCSSALLDRHFEVFIKQGITDVIIFVMGVVATHWVPFANYTFLAWVILAVKVFLIWVVIAGVVNCVVYRPFIAMLISRVKAKLK